MLVMNDYFHDLKDYSRGTSDSEFTVTPVNVAANTNVLSYVKHVFSLQISK